MSGEYSEPDLPRKPIFHRYATVGVGRGRESRIYAEQIPNTTSATRGDIQNERSRRSLESNTNMIGGYKMYFPKSKAPTIKSKKYWQLLRRALVEEYIDLGIENTASLISRAGQQWSFFLLFYHLLPRGKYSVQ